MTVTFLQAQVTKSATFVGAGVDVSGITGDFTIKCKVHGDESATGGAASLLAGQAARIVIEESVDNFTTIFALKVFNFLGGMPPEGANLSVKKEDLAKTSKFGT